MAAERTFVLVKPDGVTRGLTGEILSRFERRGLKIVALKMLKVDRSLAEEYYAEHKSKDFFQGLIEYIISGPSVAAILEGNDAVATVRSMMGATNPAKAQQGTIRADFGLDILRNVIHGSDSPGSAAREAALFFKDDEIEHYERTDVNWPK